MSISKVVEICNKYIIDNTPDLKKVLISYLNRNHRNCSKYNTLIRRNYISINQAIEICNKHILDYNPDVKICLRPSLQMNGDQPRNFLLKLKLPEVLDYTGPVGVLTVTSIWKAFCSSVLNFPKLSARTLLE